jgi:L-ornithine Nalpha-acyltransferase
MPLAPRILIKKWSAAKPFRLWPHRLKAISVRRRTQSSDVIKSRRPLFGQGRHAVGKIYGSIGPLEVRLAQSRADVRAAQRLRYRVFFEEMSATPSMTAALRRRDEDPYDPLCDHLLVVDRTGSPVRPERPWRRRSSVEPIVGTYRILRQHVAERHDGFYSQGEYNVAPLLAAKSDLQFMELGRSCVLPSHRTKRTIELLWHGLWTYIRENGVGGMIGCASFEGTDPEQHALALSYLHQNALAPPEWRVRAHEARWIAMDRMPAGKVDAKAALKSIPPLIKGYLRLGAYVGDGAVIDHQFGTTDVMIILPVERIDPRYFARFGAPDELTSRIRPEAGGVM